MVSAVDCTYSASENARWSAKNPNIFLGFVGLRGTPRGAVGPWGRATPVGTRTVPKATVLSIVEAFLTEIPSSIRQGRLKLHPSFCAASQNVNPLLRY